MTQFDLSTTCRAPATEVWALLYDPARFPEWWVGTERMEGDRREVSRYTSTYPGEAFPLNVRSTGHGSRVMISCLRFGIAWEWTLEPAETGCGVRLQVRGTDEHADLVDGQREDMRESLERLVALAERDLAR